MRIQSLGLLALTTALGLSTTPIPVSAADAPSRPAIVLVHGAFADAAGWAPVIAILQKDGYRVTAVENPLDSFADDVSTTKRAIDAQLGPVVLVGHSYGGAVITEAAADRASVKALVYLAAIVPEAGEPVAAFLDKYPTDLGTAQKIDAAGFVTIDPAKFGPVFAADLPAEQAAIAAATQKPIKAGNFGASPAHAAWKSVPSWYVVSRQDHALSPDLERFYARRIGARITELDASHVAFLSRSKEVAAVIEEAANAR
ncbi:alpha/beta fold hydrolase [Sphingobium sp. EM0848]|uniref:alpha/beta fold hydrolase n=1 Tax=Sphingobium sp. EM0848 TaxID=2743473 RepID=UPI00159C3812|nr:alpha/beta hydrolase [Sphingobium sp. EM0848]